MRLLLINPLVRVWSEPTVPPLGLLYLSSVLKREGHDAHIFDINGKRCSTEEAEAWLANANYDLYGIGGIVTTYASALQLTHIIKKYHPGAPVVWGGPLTTSSAQVLAQHPQIDALVIGEGEKAILEVVRDLEQGRLKKTYSCLSIDNLDEVPFPDRDNLDTHSRYLKAAVGGLNPRKWLDGKPVKDIRVGCIISSRSCPFNCHFCYSKYLGQGYRSRSVENVVDEIELLVTKYGVQYIHFCDELSLTKKRALEFCSEKARRGIQIQWGGGMRLDILDEPTLAIMREQGLVHIGTGIESFNPRMLKAMNKPLNIDRAKKNLSMAKRMLPDVQYTLIIGYPGETEASLEETFKGVAEVGFPPEQAFFATPYPGTALYRYALENGYITDEAAFLKELSDHEQGSYPIINFSELPDEVLIAAKKRVEG